MTPMANTLALSRPPGAGERERALGQPCVCPAGLQEGVGPLVHVQHGGGRESSLTAKAPVRQTVPDKRFPDAWYTLPVCVCEWR